MADIHFPTTFFLVGANVRNLPSLSQTTCMQQDGKKKKAWIFIDGFLKRVDESMP